MHGRILLIAALATGCSGGGKKTDAPKGESSRTAEGGERSGPKYLIGVVGQRGVETCSGGSSEWSDVAPMIGLVPVNEAPGLDELMGKPVVASGYATELPDSAPPSALTAATCSDRQARSDWVFTPRGVVRKRDHRPEKVEYYVVEDVRPLKELRVRVNAGGVHVEFDNPVPVSLIRAEIAVHYEGCFGKPVSTYKTIQPDTVGVDGSIAGDLEAVITQQGFKGERAFRAYSVQVRAQSKDVALDLDVELSSLGLEVKCP